MVQFSRATALALLTVAALSSARAADETTLDPVTVSATRIGKPGFDVPASISRIALDTPTSGIGLSSVLQAVPGVSARERENYAQDAQISIRGFGARSAFGIRGLRLYVDGIPATQPDGQGQISHFNLATADHVEVLRGPFSALYGNASGGVVQLFTAQGSSAPQLDVAGFAGAYGDQRLSLIGQGDHVIAGLSLFKTEGYRPHSAAQRTSFNGRFDHAVAGGTLTVLLNHFDAPDAQDPLGLTRAQFEHDPQQAAEAARLFDTRKNVQQTQLGVTYQTPIFAWGSLRFLGYGGQREIEQFLAIPVSAQSSPKHSGGVVDLGTGYGGGDLRWAWQAHEHLSLVAGISVDTLHQQRQGFENFSGSTLGVRGRLRRDERNTVSALDQYLQIDWTLTPALSTLAGLRRSTVQFGSVDRYITPGNPDDSGRLHYAALTPVAGLLYRHSATLHGYASYGTGFETPTLAELAYRPDGASGLNSSLVAARSRNAEAGTKWRPTSRSTATLALFRSEVRDELVTASNSSGRATFTNAARTRRDGAELQFDATLHPQLDISLAYTQLDASVRASYRSCSRVPCSTANTLIAKGTPLPGVANSQLFTRLRYRHSHAWQLSAEYRYLAAIPVNDLGSEAAPSYHVTDVEALFNLLAPDRNSLRLSLRFENIFDAHYVGSVIVNDGNSRYYEPARSRTARLGIEMGLRP